MKITVYGRKGCERCDKSKEKLTLMKLPYEFIDIDKTHHLELHDGWRTDHSVEVLASYWLQEGPIRLPIICIDGKYYGYLDALKALKSAGSK